MHKTVAAMMMVRGMTVPVMMVQVMMVQAMTVRGMMGLRMTARRMMMAGSPAMMADKRYRNATLLTGRAPLLAPLGQRRRGGFA